MNHPSRRTGVPAKAAYAAAFAVLTALMCFALFAVLGRPGVNATDEATYGINAYEMAVHGNPWISTLKYQTDYYNSKPPLMQWLIMLSYRLTGYTPLAIRLPSAVCALLLFLGIAVFLRRHAGRCASLLFMVLLPGCAPLFHFHMFRSGDCDSLYALCFALAMYGLYAALTKPWALVLFGLGLGLGFMSKSFHAAVIFLIGVLFLPWLTGIIGGRSTAGGEKSRALPRARHYLAAAACAVLPAVPWAVMRYRFDGLDYFRAAFMTESVERVSRGYLSPVLTLQLLRDPAMRICLALILCAAAAGGAGALRAKHAGGGAAADACTAQGGVPLPLYVLAGLWSAVPVAAFTALGSGVEWYIYPSYIGLCVAGALAGGSLIRRFSALGAGELQDGASAPARAARLFLSRALPALILALTAAASLSLARAEIRTYPFHGDGGDPATRFYDDCLEIRRKEGDSLAGKRCYIENTKNLYKSRECWELPQVFYAETSLDVICADGGVAGFLAEEDALLILDKDLWDEYAGVLTGHVILEDNGYLTFSSRMYGE